MSKKQQSPENQRFIRLVTENKKKYKVSHVTTGEVAGFNPHWVPSVMNGRSSADQLDIDQLLKSFPKLDPANKDESISETVKRMDQELEDLKKQFAEQQAIWDEKSKILEIAKALADQLGKENE
jgi:hypothetical protein